MPKVSESHRASRRDQIIDAAIECFLRRGIRATTMAEIIAESGLSSGAIYSYFNSKSALALAVIRREGAGRAAAIQAASNGGPLSPTGMLRAINDALASRPAAPAIIVQMWGEATSDPDFAAVTAAAFEEIANAFREPLLKWAAAERGLDAVASRRWVDRVLPTLVALTQGLVLQQTLIPDFEGERFFTGVDEVFSQLHE